MLLKRLYDRSGFDPDALARARAELDVLLAEAQVNARKRVVLTKEASAAIMAKRKEVAALTPTTTGVTVKNTGATANQNFSLELIARGQREGWLKMDGGRITVRSEQEAVTDPAKPNDRTRSHEADYVFKVVRGPGYYCCHCDESIEDEGTAPGPDGLTAGQRHVVENHGDAVSPDANNPAGYRRINHYETVLEGA